MATGGGDDNASPSGGTDGIPVDDSWRALIADSHPAALLLLDSLADAVMVVDASRRVRRTNPAFERLFGYPGHEVVGRTTEFLYADPGDFQAVWDAHYAGAEVAIGKCYRVRYRRRDGNVFWSESCVAALQAGAPPGYIGMHRDISEQIAAEQALEEARDRFEVIFRTAPLAMAYGDLETGRFTDVNGAFESLCGRQRADLLGRDAHELGLCTDPRMLERAMRELRETGLTEGYQTWLQGAGGAGRDVAVTFGRVSLQGNWHFLAMLIDITEREEARRVVERSHRELEDLVRSRTTQLQTANAELHQRAAEIADLYDRAPCGYHALLPDGTVSSVNATELEMLGYDRDDFVGRPIHAFMTPASRQLFFERFPQFLQRGEACDMEYDFVRRDGSLLPVLISAVMIRDAQGRHVSNRATMIDNSERKARALQIEAMQRELERRAEMAEAASRAKSAFLANISHEIRTPLNAVLGMTHLVERATEDPVQRDRLAKVQVAARHLLNVINDVLDISKIEAGKLTLERVEFSLESVLSKALQFVAEPARRKGLELRVDTDDAPARLVGDPTRLSQALINLMSNAVKFTASGWVRLGARVIGSRPGAVTLRFEVADTGPGVPAEVRQDLFKAFSQADVSTTRRHGGTGLGLALTRELAALMNGEVGVDSVEGAGSTFWFTAVLMVPADSAGDEAPMPSDRNDASATLEALLRSAHARLRVLVAEDNPVNQEVATALLESAGLVVVTASDGEEATELALREHFDAVLMDVQMPQVDGLEATRRIRSAGRQSLPIIAMTANAFAEERAACLAAGMNDHLTKPVAPEALYAALLHWLSPRS